jgi:two-component system, LuxR family, sensor kinase FixL
LADSSTNPSLSVLYIFPMILGALVLSPWQTTGLALACALIRSHFDHPTSQAELVLRFFFAAFAYAASGLLVTALVRNRQMVTAHLNRLQIEQGLRREVEEQLKELVSSSPAGILTLNAQGVVLASNRATASIFGLADDSTLVGRGIAEYLPVLSDALRIPTSSELFRTAAQCQGHRENGEIFLAHTWFSSYATPQGLHLAAIVVDASEEMRDREEQSLRQLRNSNRITAAAVSHELRNTCSAISLLCSHMRDKPAFAADEDFQGLSNLVAGLRKITALNLQSRATEVDTSVPLRFVLDNLRIIIEPEWQDMDGTVNWEFLSDLPTVLADPHGLLQTFLNLAQNSRRAVEKRSRRELNIQVSATAERAYVRFTDSGEGVANPDILFQPFQTGASGSGLGLYVSRAVVRTYGGELRFEPRPSGACFVVELQTT